MPNTHCQRRHDETVELHRVSVSGVYMNSQPAHDDCRDVNAAVGCDPVYNNSAANAIEVGYDVTYDGACL